MSDETPANETPAQMVPKSRLDSAIRARDEVSKKLEAREAELMQQIESLTSKLSETESRFVARESFISIGMDPDKDARAVKALREVYEDLPKSNRPTLTEWLKTGATEDPFASRLLPQKPAEVPAETPAAPAATAPETPAAPPATPRPTSTNIGTQPTPPAGKRMSRTAWEQKGREIYEDRNLDAAQKKEAMSALDNEYFGRG